MPTHGSVCILEMLQADGSQFRAAHGRASGVELTTECIEVPGGKGQPLGPAAKKTRKHNNNKKVLFLPQTPVRGVTALLWLPQFRLSQELLCQVEMRWCQARTPLLSWLAVAEAEPVALLTLLAELWR